MMPPMMPQTRPTDSPLHVDPLVLADRMIALAREADHAGFIDAASRLVGMAFAVFDETPRRRH